MGTHPAFYGPVEEGGEEHALRIAKVGNVEDRVTWTAVWHEEQMANVQRFTFDPGLEAGRSQNVVKLHSQIEAIPVREEDRDIKKAEFVEGGIFDHHDQVTEGKVAPLAPVMLKDVGQ